MERWSRNDNNIRKLLNMSGFDCNNDMKMVERKWNNFLIFPFNLSSISISIQFHLWFFSFSLLWWELLYILLISVRIRILTIRTYCMYPYLVGGQTKSDGRMWEPLVCEQTDIVFADGVSPAGSVSGLWQAIE